MRLVQVFVPRGERDLVCAALENENTEYTVTEETSAGRFEAIVSIPVAPSDVEPLLARLREAGLDDDSYTVVLPTETVVSRRTTEADRRFSSVRISREELQARAEELAPATSTYLSLLVLSTVIATAGLLANSTATIIGAMVVAPLMGPALAASVGAVVDDEDLAGRGVSLQVGGLVVVIATAAITGYALRGTVLLPPGVDITTIPAVRERITPDVLALALALGSGGAGVISLTRNVGSVLVGVAIAVALVPPAATVGLGIAWWHPTVVLTAGTLVLVNLLSINLVALILLWGFGYRPRRTARVDQVFESVVSRAAILFVAIAVLTVILAGVTYGTYQTAAVEHDVRTELEAMDEDPTFGQLHFRDADVEYELVDVYADRRPAVTIVVERPQGARESPVFVDRVRDRLASATDTDPHVVVELVDAQRSD